MRELPTPKGRYEFKGSEVIGHKRYYDDDGNFIEEVWTKNGKHYISKGETGRHGSGRTEKSDRRRALVLRALFLYS